MRQGRATMVDGSRSSLTVTFPATHGNMTSIAHILTSYPPYRVSCTVDGDTRTLKLRGHPMVILSSLSMLISEVQIGGSEQCCIDVRMGLSYVRLKLRDGTGNTKSGLDKEPGS